MIKCKEELNLISVEKQKLATEIQNFGINKRIFI